MSGISITCFAASYGLTLLLEISRLFFRIPVRVAVMVGIALAGLLAHSLYLTVVARAELLSGSKDTLLSNWHDWCLVAAWVLTAVYLGFVLSRPQNAVGIFLLPIVLILIGVAVLVQDAPGFARHDALSVWHKIHGIALLIGTVTVSLGFVVGLMYLFQSYRLKHKLSPRSGLKLPSLEWLLKINQRSLIVSTALLAIGLASGIILNLIESNATLQWTDPVILSSGVLFAWLLAATFFEYTYKPARQGQKVAYLTLASFLFLAMALWFALQGHHAGPSGPDELTLRVVTSNSTGSRLSACGQPGVVA